jgi:hypothetical protein
MLLFRNPSIFEYDYQGMKSHFLSTFGNELIEWQYHPKNHEKLKRLVNLGIKMVKDYFNIMIMRIIHFIIFFDFFDEENIYTERNSITIDDECENTTNEIMSFLYNQYYKKYEGNFIHCWYGFIELNKMNEMICVDDFNDEEDDVFFNKKIDIPYQITFIKKATFDDNVIKRIDKPYQITFINEATTNTIPKKNDVVCCVFDYNSFFNSFYTEVESFVFTVSDDFQNQIKELYSTVEWKRYNHWNEYSIKINCHYIIKGSLHSWSEFIMT